MKKIYFLFCVCAISVTGWGQLVLNEPFNYTPHATLGLSAQSAGVWGIINTGDSILVDNGSLTYTGLAASTGNKAKFDAAGTDYYTDFTSQTTGTIYSSCILNVSALGGLTTTGGYFSGFLQGGSTSLFGATVWARLSTTAGKYNIGISTRSNSAVTWLAPDLDPGTSYFIVRSYDIIAGTGNDVSRIWLNTTAIGGSEPAADATAVAGTDLTSVARFFLRQDNATNTPFVEFDELRVGTTWQSVTPAGSVATPTITATSLTAFGNICINTTAGPNSFTITGTNLTAANVTVGALAGYTYSTTSGGTYTTSLSLVQPGGAYSQQVFVKFTPTAVQSYDGNIPVGGGGATSVNVAASGSGVSVPVVTTGASSAVTTTTATLAGTIVANGCSAVTAYGIEYSTTNNFPNGTGTPVASTNLSGGNFSSNVAGLVAGTTYYYHAYATNGSGTGYGSQQTFTTSSSSSTAGLVISQIYGAGGNAGATYNADYVELHNTTASPISFSGYSIQYASATSVTTWSGVAALPAAIIPAGGYYLIQMTAPGAVGIAIPTADAVASPAINMSGTAGRVALVNGITALVACPTAANYVDLVGFGTTDICFEGSGPAGAPVSTTADFRKNNGCTQTHDNANDFEVLNALPRNSASPAFLCSAATPTLSATTLTAFGNQCINTTAGPNSFTITGTALTAANVTVGALAGFTYSTTSGGTYTSSLSLTQPGGAYSQQVFVKFTPTAVQSYNGNIPVGGGGAVTVNVAAAGAGVNTIPSVTTGAASAITASTATLAGSITANGCTAVTAYGVEYSTTNGFANGSGTPVASTNLSAGNFSSNLIGLAASTTYYYHAYATNAGGTGYGAQQSFTTAAPSPALSAGALTAFGNVCINTTAGPNSFTITGTNLTAANVTVGALPGFTYSTTSGGTYTTSLSLTQPGGAYSQQIFVKFSPTVVQSYNGNIPVGGGGASSINVAASGAGVNTVPSLTTGAATAITTSSATLAGTITANGCTAITAYGIEYSITAGFANGSGTAALSTNLSGGNFTSGLSGLAPNTIYYYHAYATNAGGTGYGAEQSFTTAALTPTLSATALTAFGNVCTNTTAGPNSFTINGSALTAANITVAALPGFSYSTTSGGTYTSSLSLTQPGGTYSQQIFVRFTPVAVQSYNGNIVVSGGGAPGSVNVAASGSGVNTAPTVTTGAATAITSISATAAGSITATGCTAISAYGIEYSTSNGFPNGTGTAVASTNLSGGNFTSDLTGLLPTTTYYYHAYATNAGGTSYGTQQSFTTATPGITVSALTAFGNICINTSAGPNSFTITGTSLSAANITVGALAGYSFSTTAAGTYTASLSLTQPGGTYSQQIFVKFNPVAVQSYNGNIPVSGGGVVAAVNVAASGAGINSAPSVTTGAASAITTTTATLAGAITATGCTAVTAYGVEYSTTNGFPNGTGTQVASTNLVAGNFTAGLSALTPSTTYYYHAFSTNAGGTAYGLQQSFTTAAPPPPVLTATALTALGTPCINTTAGPNSFTITGTNLTTANINVGPLAGFTFSTTSGGVYTASLSLTQPGGAFSQAIFVKFTPTAVQSYNGNIAVAGGGATTINVAATGSGVNTLASVTTVAASALTFTTSTATLGGTIVATGCSTVTAYGIEYSGTNGFGNGTGTQVPSTNLAAGNFSSLLTGLVQGATYYYKAYAVNSGGTAYGAQQSFTVPSIPAGFVLYPVPVKKGELLHVSMNNLTPGNYSLLFFNSDGKLAYQRNINIQANFINQSFTVPATLGPGTYRVQLVNNLKILSTKSILIL